MIKLTFCLKFVLFCVTTLRFSRENCYNSKNAWFRNQNNPATRSQYIHIGTCMDACMYHYVSMLRCTSELLSLRSMETAQFDVIRSCVTSNQMLRSNMHCEELFPRFEAMETHAYLDSERATPKCIAAWKHSDSVLDVCLE